MKKKIAIVLLSIVAVTAAIFLSRQKSTGPYEAATGAAVFFQEENSVAVSINSKAKMNAAGVLCRDGYLKPIIGMDGSTAAFVTDYHENTGGVLWYASASGVTKVSENVIGFQLSANGKALAYCMSPEGGGAGDLWLFSEGSGKSTPLREKISADRICLSPNGKTVGYTVAEGAERFTGYIQKTGKQAESLGENRAAAAISDGGLVYFFDYADANEPGAFPLLSKKSGTETSISFVGENNSLYFNKDLTQLVFNAEGRTYISRNGGVREEMANTELQTLVLPRFTSHFASVGYPATVAMYGVNTMEGMVLITYGGIMHQDKNIAASPVDEAALTLDGNALYLLDDQNTLLRFALNAEAVAENPTVLARDVRHFTMSEDERLIYFIGTDDALYCVKNNETARIADQVETAIALSERTCFFIAEGKLYSSEDGGESTPIESGGAVYSVWATPANAFCLAEGADNHYEVYRGVGGLFLYFAEEVKP